jgi:spiro-SPASM protein
MEILYKESLVNQIILETNGIELKPQLLEKLLRYQDKLFIIVNINALDAESYTEIHGKDQFARILENLENINKELITKKEFITVQFLKINQTQNIIDPFYSFWHDRKLNVLLQKQNTFNGLVKDFRFSDLTPLERFPCWHLKRDLVILADGAVTVCKQDIQGQKILGNFQELGLNEIWENGKNIAIQEAKKEFPQYPACAKCDEWYTFNF